MTNYIIESCKSVGDTLKNKFDEHSRIAIIGIGNEIRYDDIAGMLVLKNLMNEDKIKKPSKKIILIEGSIAPFEKVNEILEWNPTHLIMLDSGELYKKPGCRRSNLS